MVTSQKDAVCKKMEDELKIAIKGYHEIQQKEGNLQEYMSNSPISLDNVRAMRQETKNGYKRLGNDVQTVLQDQATEIDKYGVQEWGAYDELYMKVQKLQEELSLKNREIITLKLQSEELQELMFGSLGLNVR